MRDKKSTGAYHNLDAEPGETTLRDKVEVALSDAVGATRIKVDDNEWDLLAVTFEKSFLRLTGKANKR